MAFYFRKKVFETFASIVNILTMLLAFPTARTQMFSSVNGTGMKVLQKNFHASLISSSKYIPLLADIYCEFSRNLILFRFRTKQVAQLEVAQERTSFMGFLNSAFNFKLLHQVATRINLEILTTRKWKLFRINCLSKSCCLRLVHSPQCDQPTFRKLFRTNFHCFMFHV